MANSPEHSRIGQLDRLASAGVRQVVRALDRVIEANLVGLYLHGSGAMGGFVPERSDIDLIAVCRRGPRDADVRLLAESLAAISPTPSGSGLEFHLVTATIARRPSRAPSFMLHLATGRDAPAVDGLGHPGDPDLVMHFAVCRERGIAVVGPAPSAVFGRIPHRWLLEAFLAEMDWAASQGSPEYRVLNAARSWRYLEEGMLSSKVEGAAWARERAQDPRLIDAALAAQVGQPGPALDDSSITRFVEDVRRRLQAQPITRRECMRMTSAQ